MSQVNGHANGQTTPTSVEDAVRQLFRDADQRKAFREKWPMYETAKLKEEIEKCDSDIQQFEEAIQKAQRYKRQCQDLLDQCEKRDNVLSNMQQK